MLCAKRCKIVVDHDRLVSVRLSLNGKKVIDSSKKDLGKALRDACLGSVEDCAISLNADGAVDYQRIVDIMDVARLSGIRKVELATKTMSQD